MVNHIKSMTQKILILSANPKKTSLLRLDQEMREIDEGLRRSKKRDRFTVEKRLAVRIEDLRRALLDEEPQFVHFCGHGGGHDGILLEDLVGCVQLVKADPLANLFKLFSKQVECVILNACYSEVQAAEISQHINYVIGMKQAIGDQAAIKFATGFYDAIGAGRSIEDAFEFGRNAIELDNIPEELTPMIKKSQKLLKSSPESAASPVQWVMVLSATIDDINKPMAETIVKHLQQLSGDASLTLKKIAKGSVILVLQSSEDGFERINYLLKSGELKELNGFRVERVQLGYEIAENEVTESLNTRRLDTMPPLNQRLANLEYLLEMDYEQLAEHEQELSMTASPKVRNEAKQRIKRDIMPRIRKNEVEYWSLLREFANRSEIVEPEAQTAIASIVQDAEIIQTKPMPDEVLQKLQEILNKLNEPGTAAAAKAKFAVNVIPGVLAYEFELDTETTLRQVFRPLKQLFGAAAKK